MGNLDDLEAEILKAELTISTTPIQIKQYGLKPWEISCCIDTIGQKNMDDLEAAIARPEQAVSMTPLNNPDRAKYLSNFAISLSNQ